MDAHKLILEDLLDSGAPEGAWLDKMVRTLNAHMEQAYRAFGQKLELETVVVDVTTKPMEFTLTPINGWTTASGATPPGAYKSPGGLVDLEGQISSGTSGTVALQVPPDLFPDRFHRVPLATSGLLGAEAVIGTNGAVTITFAGTPTSIDLGGLSWTAFDHHAAVNSAFPIKVKTTLPKVSGVLVADVTPLTHPHVGAAVGVEWHMDGKTLVISNIPGLTDGQSYKVKLLILGNLG